MGGKHFGWEWGGRTPSSSIVPNGQVMQFREKSRIQRRNQVEATLGEDGLLKFPDQCRRSQGGETTRAGHLRERQANERWLTNVEVKKGGIYLQSTEYTWGTSLGQLFMLPFLRECETLQLRPVPDEC